MYISIQIYLFVRKVDVNIRDQSWTILLKLNSQGSWLAYTTPETLQAPSWASRTIGQVELCSRHFQKAGAT